MYRIKDKFGFFILTTIFLSLAGTMLCETIVYSSKTLRESYLGNSFPILMKFHLFSLFFSGIPAAVFLLFLFSGLIVKPDVLPSYLKCWVPSISVIRWTLQVYRNFSKKYQPLIYFILCRLRSSISLKTQVVKRLVIHPIVVSS